MPPARTGAAEQEIRKRAAERRSRGAGIARGRLRPPLRGQRRRRLAADARLRFRLLRRRRRRRRRRFVHRRARARDGAPRQLFVRRFTIDRVLVRSVELTVRLADRLALGVGDRADA